MSGPAGPTLLMDAAGGSGPPKPRAGAAVCALDPDAALHRLCRMRPEADAFLAIHPTDSRGAAGWRHDGNLIPCTGFEIMGPGCRRYADDPLAAFLDEADSRPEGALGSGALHEMRSSAVIIAGCGGLGSAAALLLAQEGVRRLWLLDFDHVEEHDLGRSPVGWRRSQIGRPKAEALADSLAEWPGPTEVRPWIGRAEDASAAWRDADASFICCDNAPARRACALAAAACLIPAVSVGTGILDWSAMGFGTEIALSFPGQGCAACVGEIPRTGSFAFGEGRRGSLRSLNMAAAGQAVLQWQLYLAGRLPQPVRQRSTASGPGPGSRRPGRLIDTLPLSCPCRSQPLGPPAGAAPA
jgi:NAD(P)-dependent dehydrogenase (short-subunit alcohol dehydrogenase family)